MNVNRKKTFTLIPNAWGGVDEQKSIDAFEDFVGGAARAAHLFSLWVNTYDDPKTVVNYWSKPKTKREKFRLKAKNDGFTDEEVNAFLLIQ